MSQLQKTRFNVIVKIISLSLIFLVLFFQLQISPAKASALTNISDTVSRLKASTASNHDIKFVSPSGVDAAGATITIAFSAAFDTATITEDDIDIAYSNDAICNVFPNELGTAAVADATNWGVVMALDVLTLTHPTDSANGDIPVNRCIQVQIGTNATSSGAGANQIINGPAANNVEISIAGTFGDTGSLGLSILSDDQGVIAATVEPSLTFSFVSNTCAFGTIERGSSNVDTCSYVITTATNATNGYVTTLAPVSDGANYALNNDSGALELFAPEDGDNIITGNKSTSSEYGVGSSDPDMGGSGEVAVEATCAEDSSVAATAIYTAGGAAPSQREVARATDPTSETVTICHAAAAGTSAPSAGTYSQTVLLISTGTF